MENKDWETISEAAQRMSVEGGWIVCYTFEGQKSSLFIPDPKHGWKA